MGKEILFDKIRSIISGLAWKTFLWSLRMTQSEYWKAIYEQEKQESIGKYNLKIKRSKE